MKKNIIFVFICMILISNSAFSATSGLDPSSLKIKLYAIWASTNEDCSNAINIFANESADYTNFLGTPELGSGNIPDGTYECLIMLMGDRIKFTPSESTDTTCVAGTEYTMEICSPGGGTSSQVDLSGTRKNCVTGEEKIHLYLSTKSTQSGSAASGNAFEPPGTSGANGLNLGSAFVVSGGAQGVFVADATSGINEQGGAGGPCNIEAPLFSFR